MTGSAPGEAVATAGVDAGESARTSARRGVTRATAVEHRFVALDSWRGIAACMVALFHLDANSHAYDLGFMRDAWLFVDFFFVLSGFIIAATYQARLAQGFGVGRFLLLRLGRVYPLHLAMLVLFVGFELLRMGAKMAFHGNPVSPFSIPSQGPDTIVAQLLLVHGLHVFDFLTWNEPSWSISTEFFAYVVFALCVVFLRRHAWVAMTVALVAGPIAIAQLSEHGMNTTYDWGFIRCLLGFAAGVAAWRVYRAAGARLRRWFSGSAAEWAAVVLAVAFVDAAGTTTLSIAAPYVFALVVLVFAFEAGSASALLKARPFVFLGTISYSIYMTHVFVERRLFDAASLLDKAAHIDLFSHREIAGQSFYFLGTAPWQGDLAYVLYLGLVVAASWFTFTRIEEPAREWVRDRVRRGRHAVAPT